MSLLQMSFSGAIFILAITLVRTFTIHKFPKKTFSVLWKIVIFRLLIPVSIPSVFSIYTLICQYLPSYQKAIPHFMDFVNPAALTDFSASSSVSLVNLPQTLDFLAAKPQSNLSVWFFIWCAGMTVCALFFLISYFACRRDFKMSLPVCNDYVAGWLKKQKLRRKISIRQSDRITSPLTYGICKPVILMPKSTDWKDAEIQYILAHEYAHIRRFDCVTKLIFILVLCIHWFNPMIWVMYFLFNQDIELACDEDVIFQFGETSKTSYAFTLINMEERKNGSTLLYNNFSKNSVEERIRSIMKHKKMSKLTIVMALIMVIGITIAFTTSPAKAESGDKSLNEDAVDVKVADGGAEITTNAEINKFKLEIEKTFEVHLAPGEEIELETIKTKQGQVLIVSQMCEGIQFVGIRLDGDHFCSSEGRLEKVGYFSSECKKEEEDRILVVYNPGDSDIDLTIGYSIMEGVQYNSLGYWDLLNYLKKEYLNK